MKRSLALLLLATACMTVQAKGNTELVAFEDAERVMFFNGRQNWQTAEGGILICPYGATTDERDYKECIDPKTKKSVWTLLTAYVPAGFEIANYSYHDYCDSYGGTGCRSLTVFFRKPKPAVADDTKTFQRQVLDLINKKRIVVTDKK
jgi:hypothetical protein